MLIGAVFQVNVTTTKSAESKVLDPIPHEPPNYKSTWDTPLDSRSGVNRPLEKSDFGFLGVEYTDWTPPDPIIAAGPEHLVVMTNGAIAFFQKNGTMDFQDEIEDSFNGIVSTASRPETIAIWLKLGLPFRFQSQLHQSLTGPICHRGNT